MKILLTGAFGNVGLSTLFELVKSDEHYIRCFDIPTKKNKRNSKKFKKYKDRVEIIWGDLRNFGDVEKAVKNIDTVIHLGAIIPPFANKFPDIAEPVNVGGTKNLIKAMQKQQKPPKLIFSSSVAIYGDVREKGDNYIISVNDPFNPSSHDHYAKQKIKCEDIIRNSGLSWVIFRFSAIMPMDQKVDPFMFEVPLDTPIEFTHTQDCGYAMARATTQPDIWGKVLHIAGGPFNRMSYETFVGRVLEAMGIGPLPKEAFSTKPFHCGYMDTEESESLLQYQKHTFKDYVQSMKERWMNLRFFILTFRPIIRHWLLSKSTHYRDHQKILKTYLKPKVRKTPISLEQSQIGKKKRIPSKTTQS